MQEQFTRYEIARITGARALQIAMDAPLLLKLSDTELKEMGYDAIKIAERELKENVLPITISRPTPRKQREKLPHLKEDLVSDEELIAKEQEVEKEIAAEAENLGFVNEGEDEEVVEAEPRKEEQ